MKNKQEAELRPFSEAIVIGSGIMTNDEEVECSLSDSKQDSKYAEAECRLSNSKQDSMYAEAEYSSSDSKQDSKYEDVECSSYNSYLDCNVGDVEFLSSDLQQDSKYEDTKFSSSDLQQVNKYEKKKQLLVNLLEIKLDEKKCSALIAILKARYNPKDDDVIAILKMDVKHDEVKDFLKLLKSGPLSFSDTFKFPKISKMKIPRYIYKQDSYPKSVKGEFHKISNANKVKRTLLNVAEAVPGATLLAIVPVAEGVAGLGVGAYKGGKLGYFYGAERGYEWMGGDENKSKIMTGLGKNIVGGTALVIGGSTGAVSGTVVGVTYGTYVVADAIRKDYKAINHFTKSRKTIDERAKYLTEITDIVNKHKASNMEPSI